MSKKKVEDWLLPPDERSKKADTDETILNAIREFGVSYPAEIVGETGLSRQTVFDRLCYLRRHGVIEKLDLRHGAPDVLKERLPDLWVQNIKGNRIRMMSFYVLKNEELEVV